MVSIYLSTSYAPERTLHYHLKKFILLTILCTNHWIRYSDGCEGQSDSGCVVAYLLHTSESYQVKSASFNFFESHGVKKLLWLYWINFLDQCSFTRVILKSQQLVCNIDDLLAVIQNESKQSKKKFDFFIVEKVGWFQKRSQNSRQYWKIDGIMALQI